MPGKVGVIMSVMEGSINFSNMDVQSSQGDREWRRFKCEQGKSYRIRFTSQNVEVRKRHYNPQDKRYYRCLGHQGYCPVCQAASQGYGGDGQFKLRKAQETFGANILVYDTDINGNPVQPLNAEVYFWSFGPDKFITIRDLQAAWGDITNLDLKVTCNDAQFQKLTIINLPNCLYSSDPNFKAACDAKIERDSYPLDKMICKEIDLMGMIEAFKLPQQYIPQEMLGMMPQGQQTVTGYANGSQPMQSVAPPQPQFAQPNAYSAQAYSAQPQANAYSASAYSAPATPAPQTPPPVANEELPFGNPAPAVQPQVAPQPTPATVTPTPQPAPQAMPSTVTPNVAPQPQPQTPPQDFTADVEDLQAMLSGS